MSALYDRDPGDEHWSTPIERLVDALEARDCRPRRVHRGWVSLCPAHDDRKPSLSVNEGDNGCALLVCRAGCATEDVLDVLGLTFRDLFQA